MMLIRSAKKMGRCFSTAERQPNIIQRLPEYHEALQFAVDKKFPEALEKLEVTTKLVEEQVGPHSKFHLFLY
jgi:hypothetical protein